MIEPAVAFVTGFESRLCHEVAVTEFGGCAIRESFADLIGVLQNSRVVHVDMRSIIRGQRKTDIDVPRSGAIKEHPIRSRCENLTTEPLTGKTSAGDLSDDPRTKRPPADHSA